MNVQNLSNTQSIKTGIFYGLISTVAIWISSLCTLNSNTKYSSNSLTTALTFGILICGIILSYKMLNRIAQLDRPTIGQFALAGIFFSLTIGTIEGLIHYINATYIDTNWAQSSLQASQGKWTINDYTKEAIAGQTELTDTFQRPWKWAVTSGIFMSIISLFLVVTIGCLYSLKNRKEEKIEVE
ncbi:MAG: DUF4199 family protein [Williamsia sp.]|nr:DUF4199 family protein [Williamsia sp.]